MIGRLSIRMADTASAPHMIAALAVAIATLGAVSFGITVNQALALAFSLLCLTLWARDRLTGLIAATMFFMTKSFWVRLAFAIEGDSAGGGFDLLGITPALLLAGLIVGRIFSDFSSGRRLCPDRSRRLLATFAAVGFVTILYCGSPLVGLGGFERNVLPNMLILFLAASVITDPADATRLLKALMIFGLVSSAYAIGQFALGLYPWEVAWFRSLAMEDGLSGWLTIGLRGIEFRIFSVCYGYMDFFFANVLIFALATASRKSWTGDWQRIYRLYAACWFAILALSLERMPIVMILIVVLALKYLGFSQSGRGKIVVTSLVTCGALYGALLLGGPALKSTGAEKLVRLAELANPFQATSMLDRTETKWLPALETIAGNPFGVGIGYGSQTRANRAAKESDNYVQPHNEIIQKTLETGLVGGLVYVLLLIAIFRENLAQTRYGDLGMFGAGMVAATLAFWACGLVNLPFSGSSGLLYWLWAGVALGLKHPMFQNETSPKQAREVADSCNVRMVQD